MGSAPRCSIHAARSPLEVLHDHVRRAVLERAHVDHARDVLALDLHRRPRLAREAGDRLGVAERLGQEELERDLLVELDVVRGDDDPHPADAEDALDAVLAGEDVAFADPLSQPSGALGVRSARESELVTRPRCTAEAPPLE
jgi:hypothetical protein